MYKDHKSWLIITGIAALMISYLLDLKFNGSLLDSIMTVLSIIFGFNVTAISTLYRRNFISNLHKKTDKELKGQTQLQTLKNYFAVSCKMALATIMFLILYQLLISKCRYIILGYIDFELLLTSLILPLISMNIILLLFLLKVFLKGLIYEAEEI